MKEDYNINGYDIKFISAKEYYDILYEIPKTTPWQIIKSMLYYITQEWDKKDRRAILTKYRTALINKKYYCTGEEGKLMNCTKYVAEYEEWIL